MDYSYENYVEYLYEVDTKKPMEKKVMTKSKRGMRIANIINGSLCSRPLWEMVFEIEDDSMI